MFKLSIFSKIKNFRYTHVLWLCLIIRFIFIFLFPYLTFPGSDYYTYDKYAQRIVINHTYGNPDPTTYQAPGTAAVYSIPYFIFGINQRYSILLNVLIAVASCHLLMKIVLELTEAREKALLSGILYSISPILINLCGRMQSENIIQIPLLCGILFLVRYFNLPTNIRLFFCIFFLCLGGLVRGNFIIFPPLAAILLFVHRASLCKREMNEGASPRAALRGFLFSVLWAMLAVSLTLLPYATRNYHAIGRFVVTQQKAGLGLFLYAPTIPNRVGLYDMIHNEEKIYSRIFPEKSPEEIYRALAIDSIKQDPLVTICQIFKERYYGLIFEPIFKETQLGPLSSPFFISQHQRERFVAFVKDYSVTYGIVLALLFLLGAANRWLNFAGFSAVLLFLFVLVFQHTLLNVIPRYGIPIHMLFLIIAANALDSSLIKNIKESSIRKKLFVLVIILFLLILILFRKLVIIM